MSNSKAHNRKTKQAWRKRRRRAYSEPYTRREIFDRDEWICGICRKHVDHVDASIDHIVPLSLGGHDTQENVQLAHTLCNSRKGNGSSIRPSTIPYYKERKLPPSQFDQGILVCDGQVVGI